MLRTLLLLLFLSAFVVSYNANAAESVHIYADQKAEDAPQQLIFEFDRPVTYVGGIPSTEQLEYVSIIKGDGNGAKKWQPQCHWRYVDTKRLACELDKPLLPGSIYYLAVKKGFVGLNDWQLDKTVKHTIRTPMPSDIFSSTHYNYSNDQSWPVLTLNATDGHGLKPWLRDLLSAPMKVGKPDGKLVDIDVKIVENRLHAPLNIDAIAFDFSQDGRYELLIPQGTQFEFADYVNDDPIVLYYHEFYQDFTLLGARCYDAKAIDSANSEEGNKPNWRLDDLTGCQPERFELAFSRHMYAQQQFKPLFLDAKLTDVRLQGVEHGRYIYRFSLGAKQRYEWDLSLLKTQKNQTLAGQKRIKFTTAEARPAWYYNSIQALNPYDKHKPLVNSVTINALEGKVTVIDSLEKLQTWIKGDVLEGQQYVWQMNYKHDYHWRRGAEQTFDFDRFLPEGSGVLALDFNIEGVGAGTEQTSQRKQASPIVNAFNLQLLLADDWLIQAASWETGEPMAGVSVNLVCADESLSRYLGQTNQLGVLSLPAISQVEQCWLWSEEAVGVHALELGSPGYYEKDIAITAYSGQPVYEPGKTIDFGILGKIRSNDGLKGFNRWGHRQLYFGREQGAQNDDVLVEMPSISPFGMASVSIQTQAHWPVGSYFLKLYHKDKPLRVSILGKVDIEYYETPEYEVTFKGTERLTVGDSFDWSLSAKRLNGVGLADAKVKVQYQVGVAGSAHFWPSGYNWLTNHLREKQNINLPVFDGKLDEAGLIAGKTRKFSSKSPVLNISANATVTAKDGEVQSHTTNGYYFGTDYFFGVETDTKNQSISLVAIDKDGNLLLNSDENEKKEPADKIAYKALENQLAELIARQGIKLQVVSSSRGKPKRTLICQLDSLQDSCLLNGLQNRLHVTVTIDESTFAKGYIYMSKHYVHQSRVPFEFTERMMNVAANDEQVQLTLTSKVTGKALIVVSGDKIESYFYQDIVKGNNQFLLPLKRRYMPQVTVEAFMTVAGAKATQDRVLNAVVQIGLQQPQQLQLDVKTPQDEQISGALFDVSIEANQFADTQTWLVNEGLWQLLGVDENAFNLHEALDVQEASQYSPLWLGAVRYVSRAMVRNMEMADSGEMMSTTGASTMKTGALSPEQKSIQSAQFADSLWFEPKHLASNSAQSLQFNLPKVPGRYKLVTLAANDDQFDLDVQTITTYLPQEYFVDAPNHMVQLDSAELLITAINRTNQPLNESLRLTIDDKPWRKLDVNGKANGQQVISVDMPRLSVGIHKLGVWHDDFGLVGLREVKVRADTVNIEKQFVLGGEDGQSINLPREYEAGSLSFVGRNMANLAPSWDAQLQFVRHYPYQCWEQSMSRAVSYAYSPIAANHWPQGRQVFERLLKGAPRYTSGGGFGYFSGFSQDDFLTAYSYLVNTWLNDKDYTIALDKQRLGDEVRVILDTHKDSEQRSMALLALAKAADLSKEQVLEYRAKIGASNGFSQVLQLLALRHVNADDELIESTIKDILRRGYQDAGVSILSDNAQRCFAYMALGQMHPRAQKLLEQVLAEQWQKGNFGTTFASAACTVAFKDKLEQSLPLVAIEYQQQDGVAKLKLADSQFKKGQRHQIKMSYKQAIERQPTFSQGIKLKQQYFIATGSGSWRLMPQDYLLQIGDLVKVVVTVDSVIGREHVVVNAPIAGAFEVDNNKFEHSVGGQLNAGLSTGSMRAGIMSRGNMSTGMNRLPVRPIMPRIEQQIELDRVLLFPYRLAEGETNFSYLLKVRHGGKFIAPGAKVELMYQPDVAAQTHATYFNVAGY